MKPDFEHAAMMAADTLIRFNVSSAPVDPLYLLKQVPGVLVKSYSDLSNEIDMDRSCVIESFADSRDAFTAVHMKDGKPHYLVTYNMRLPYFLLQRSLARELGHIVLGHEGSLPEDVRNEEARCFAHHLLAPRALVYQIRQIGIRFTTDVLANLTGCNDYCQQCMRRLPPVHVPAEMNRTIRNNMMPFIFDYFEMQRQLAPFDGSALVDLGQYMEGYEE